MEFVTALRQGDRWTLVGDYVIITNENYEVRLVNLISKEVELL